MFIENVEKPGTGKNKTAENNFHVMYGEVHRYSALPPFVMTANIFLNFLNSKSVRFTVSWTSPYTLNVIFTVFFLEV
jgi:hypothetical protein